MNWIRVGVILLFGVLSWNVSGQQIELFQQFNGRYDYISIGNTLNLEENAGGSSCDILTSSSAEFVLPFGQQVIAAYLYWAGSGPGDFEVTLNNNPKPK